jgi:hypothetical protein
MAYPALQRDHESVRPLLITGEVDVQNFGGVSSHGWALMEVDFEEETISVERFMTGHRRDHCDHCKHNRDHSHPGGPRHLLCHPGGHHHQLRHHGKRRLLFICQNPSKTEFDRYRGGTSKQNSEIALGRGSLKFVMDQERIRTTFAKAGQQ